MKKVNWSIIAMLFCVSTFSVLQNVYSQDKNKEESEFNPLSLVHKTSSITISFSSSMEVISGLNDFLKRGFGSIGQMALAKVRQMAKSQLQEDILSPIGLYLAGINPVKPVIISIAKSPFNQQTQKRKTSLTILVPVQNKKSLENFITKMHSKSKKSGSIIKANENGLDYVKVGQNLYYAFYNNYLIAAESKNLLFLALAAHKRNENILQQPHIKNIFQEVKKYPVRFFIEPKSMGDLVMEFTKKIIRKKGLKSAIPLEQLQKTGMEIYEALSYGMDFNKNGIRIFTIGYLSKMTDDMGLLRAYGDLSTAPRANPDIYLSSHPLFFASAALNGEGLLEFVSKYMESLYDTDLKKTENLDSVFQKYKEKTGLDLKENLIKNIISPIQFFAGNFKMPVNMDNFLKGELFFSFGYKDSQKLNQFLGNMQKFVKKKTEEDKKRGSHDSVELKKRAPWKDGNIHPWEIIIQKADPKKGNKIKLHKYQLILHDNIKPGLGLCYVGFEGFDYNALLKEIQRQGKAGFQDKLSLGMKDPQGKNYGKTLGNFYFDFKKVSEYIASYEQNIILLQVKLILDNFDKWLSVSRLDTPWMRSWMEIRLKKTN